MNKKKNVKNQLHQSVSNEMKKNKEVKRIGCWVPLGFHNSFKSQAAKEGLFLEQLVFKALIEYLNRRQEGKEEGK